MPDKIDEILYEVKSLNTKLYGEDGFEGDVQEIKAGLKNHDKRIKRTELIIAGLIGTGALSGGIAGLIQLLGG